MKEIIDLMNHVLTAERMQGKYAGLFLLSLLFLWMAPKDFSGRKGKKLALFAFVLLCLICFVPLLLVILKTIGFGDTFWEYLWVIPGLAVIAYTAVELCMMRKERKWFWSAASACMLLILLSGTVLPFQSDVPKQKYTDRSAERVLAVVSSQKELYGGEVLLLAPEEVLEKARAYDGDIRLVYGKDMWDVQANTAIADDYSQDIRLLYEKMKQDFAYPDEAADSAKWYGCDMLVLREKLTPGSVQEQEWMLVEEVSGYVVYRYIGQTEV